MAVRPRAPPAQLLRRLESSGAGGPACSSRMGTLSDNHHHFPSGRIHLCSRWGRWCRCCVECVVRLWGCLVKEPQPGLLWLQLGSIHVGTFSSLFRHTFPLLQQFQTGHRQLCEPQNLQHEAKLPVIFAWRTCEMAGWRPGFSIQTPVNSSSNINFVHVLFGWIYSFWHKQSKNLIFHGNTVMSDYYYRQPHAKQNKTKNKGHFLFKCGDSSQVFPHLNGR